MIHHKKGIPFYQNIANIIQNNADNKLKGLINDIGDQQ